MIRRMARPQRLPAFSFSIKRNHLGYIYIAPWLVGFVIFTFGPMLASLVLSFHNYRIISPPQWIGLNNYIFAFKHDELFYLSIGKTFYYVFFFVPLSMACSLFLAMLLNQRTKGESIFRTLFYLPTLTPAPAAAVLWVWILNSRALGDARDHPHYAVD